MLISMSANAGFLRSPDWNSRSSSAITSQAPFATAVALRGDCVMAASSPKISPAFTVPIALRPASRLTSPESRR
jgi:hypothetical protein